MVSKKASSICPWWDDQPRCKRQLVINDGRPSLNGDSLKPRPKPSPEKQVEHPETEKPKDIIGPPEQGEKKPDVIYPTNKAKKK